MTVNRTDSKGRSKANITGVRALCVDLDGANPMNIERLRLRASCGVETSHDRYHFNWVVRGVQLEEFPYLQKRIAILMGGDVSVCDLSRRNAAARVCTSKARAVHGPRFSPA